ncbi:MAG: choice-of-anchor S family protein [Candidatus Thorarchaeota archaeon]
MGKYILQKCLIIFALFLFSNCYLSHSEYNVINGQIFSYEIISYNVGCRYGNQTLVFNGSDIGDTIFPGSYFNITISSVNTEIIVYYIENYEYSMYMSLYTQNQKEAFNYILGHSYDIAYLFTNWNLVVNTNNSGLAINFIPFIVNCEKSTWIMFSNLAEEYRSSINSLMNEHLISCTESLKETRKEIVIEWYIEGFLSNPHLGTNLTLTNYNYNTNIKIAYSKLDGTLLGYNVQGNGIGEVEGMPYIIDIDEKILLDGYTLDDFHLGTYSNNSSLYFINMILVLPVLYIKRKNGYLPK